jgi:hypothetical protein
VIARRLARADESGASCERFSEEGSSMIVLTTGASALLRLMRERREAEDETPDDAITR